jgi:DNA-binding response OmpR family regulator
MRSTNEHNEPDGAACPRVLLFVAPDDESRWSALARSGGFLPHPAASFSDARRLLGAMEFDVILMDETAGACCDRLSRHIERHRLCARIVGILPTERLRDTIAWIRRGASDIVASDVEVAELRERLTAAAQRARADRDRAAGAQRLRLACRRLTDAVHQSETKIESLSRDVAQLASDAETRIADAATAAEFRAILSQELDLESLLRTALQYLLKKTGPTNAAIFLPDAQGEFSLGAYVNYDCDRDSANLLLDHVCGSICPHLTKEPAIVRFEDGDELATFLGEQASIIRGRDVIACRCAHGSRTLAILLLFRDRADAFRADLPATLDLLRPLFAAQLDSILRVHHRARPQWPREAAEDAAESDDEFGFGLAA